MKYENILETIGNTPVLNISRLFPEAMAKKIDVWAKLEKQNPGGSIKDRIACAMIEDAEKKGHLKAGGVIVEPTSGNTGVGLAMVAAIKGYDVILVMPESFSVERRKIMKAFGARLELTSKENGMKGAIDKAKEISEKIEGSWVPMQFENEINPEIHAKTTAHEILKDFPNGIDYFVAGVGTGGHLTGCARTLKKKFPKIKIFPVEPENSAVISGNFSGTHSIQGIGAGFIPKNLDLSIIDSPVTVSDDEAFSFTKKAALETGLLVGISSGAVLAAISKLLPEFDEKSTVLTFCYDSGERYLTVPDLFCSGGLS